MMQYYYMHRGMIKRRGVAHAPPGTDTFLIPSGAFIRNWKPITLSLGAGLLMDNLPSNIEMLYSLKLKAVIEPFLSTDIAVQWLPAKVLDHEGKLQDYWFMHFTAFPDVLDWERSQVIDRKAEVVGKIVLDVEKIRGRHIFGALRSDITIFISEDLKKAIQASGCTGIVYSKVPDNRGMKSDGAAI